MSRSLRAASLLLASFFLLSGSLLVPLSLIHAAGGTTVPSGGGGSTVPSGGGGSTVPSDSSVSSSGLINPLNHIDSFDQLLSAILDAVIYLGGIVLVLMLVYVGFLFVVAQGNEEKITSARTALLWTVIGGLILLGAKAIMLVIQGTVAGL